MINVSKTLEHMNIPTHSVSRAITSVRGRLDRAGEVIGAQKFIKELLDVDVKFTSTDQARIAAFNVVQDAIRNEGVITDAEDFVSTAISKANKFVNNPDHAWLFVKPGAYESSAVVTEAVVDGISTQVEVRADGKIKKGGKKILAVELYNREASKGEVHAPDFVKILMKELGMSIAGARTYAHFCKTSYNTGS